MHWHKTSPGQFAVLWPALLALLWLLVISNGQVVFRPHFLYKQKQKEKEDHRREFEEAQRREQEQLVQPFETEYFPRPPPSAPPLYPNYYDPYYYHYYQHSRAQQNQRYRKRRDVKKQPGLMYLVYTSKY